MAPTEIFKVQVKIGEQSLGTGYKPIDKLVVFLIANTLVALSKIEVVVEKFLSVGSCVQNHRQNAAWVDACSGGIHHELTNGNLNAIGTPVTNAQDSLSVRDDDEVNVSTASGILQRSFNVFRMVGGKKAGILRVNIALGIVLNIRRDGGIVHNGHELFEMFGEEVIEQGTILGKQAHQVMALCLVVSLCQIIFIGLISLLINGLYAGRQKSNKTVFFSLFCGKSSSLIQKRVVK